MACNGTVQMSEQATAVNTAGWTLRDWQQAYRQGMPPSALLLPLLNALTTSDPAWISLITPAQLQAQLDALLSSGASPASQPLFGVPLAVKDNIDVAGLPTTAACPAFSYQPEADAHCVARLRAAGAIIIGKTNLDQFATGLVGTRSPYGAVVNSFSSRHVGGGSSSGSASVVARGLVPLALGTDTAGSGRVPAGFNNIVGLKPSRGWLSSSGVVPACRSLDCVSVFALTVDDALLAARLAGGDDERDPFSRRPCWPTAVAPKRLAIPATTPWFGDIEQADAWQLALAQAQALGLELVETDFTPLWQLAALLYEGPWLAERDVAVGAFLRANPDAVNPVVLDIINKAGRFSASDSFRGHYRRAELLRQLETLWQQVDGLLVPTSPRLPTLAEVTAAPVVVNSQLGTWTNFVNLADCCALALPAPFRSDGLPAGITLIAPAWRDQGLALLGQQWQQALALPLGATGRSLPAAQPLTVDEPEQVQIAVVGAHLTGMPLNHQLTSRGGRLLAATTTAPSYRLFALPGTVPPKPGLAHVGADGQAIAVELWSLPLTQFGSFVAEVPPPLAIGSLELADGRLVKGFVCEPRGLNGARDITHFGGWRAFMAASAASL